jgi:hypothetical protein
LAPVNPLIPVPDTLAMTLIFTRHTGKSKAELLDEIVRLEKELKSRNDEIAMLKKKITLYKSI